ncbi:MAG TPA: alpha/beta hydrolase [Acidobacteriaceae bacterium]
MIRRRRPTRRSLSMLDRIGFFTYDPSKSVPSFLKTLTNTMTASINQAFLESPSASESPPLDDLAKVRAKTLLVEGRQDPVCPLDESERIHTGITGSKLVEIDKSGHFPWLEQPAEFFNAVVDFEEAERSLIGSRLPPSTVGWSNAHLFPDLDFTNLPLMSGSRPETSILNRDRQ